MASAPIRRIVPTLRGPKVNRDVRGDRQHHRAPRGGKCLASLKEASLEEINQHYRQAMRMYHPDKVAGMAPEIIALAERRTKELNAAFSQAKRVRSGAAK